MYGLYRTDFFSKNVRFVQFFPPKYVRICSVNVRIVKLLIQVRKAPIFPLFFTKQCFKGPTVVVRALTLKYWVTGKLS